MQCKNARKKQRQKNKNISTREKKNKKRIHSDTTTIQINVVGLWFLSANNVNTLPKICKSVILVHFTIWPKIVIYVKQSLHEIVKKFVSYTLHGSDVKFVNTVFLFK